VYSIVNSRRKFFQQKKIYIYIYIFFFKLTFYNSSKWFLKKYFSEDIQFPCILRHTSSLVQSYHILWLIVLRFEDVPIQCISNLFTSLLQTYDSKCGGALAISKYLTNGLRTKSLIRSAATVVFYLKH
jgi:hypothetical protein